MSCFESGSTPHSYPLGLWWLNPPPDWFNDENPLSGWLAPGAGLSCGHAVVSGSTIGYGGLSVSLSRPCHNHTEWALRTALTFNA